MTQQLRLVIFDVDGTLVDSRHHIITSMQRAFEEFELPIPTDAAILNGVGLSLPELMAQLVPTEDTSTHRELAVRYKKLSFARHAAAGEDVESPFFAGMRELLDHLRCDDHTLLATATGNSRRGLNRIIAHHGLEGYFQSTQVADNHPSKPNPSMVLTALAETGVEPDNAIMIGDTSYDVLMGNAAGVSTVGVGWGYQTRDMLADANMIVDSADALAETLQTWMEHFR